MRIVSFGQVVELNGGRPEIANQMTVELVNGYRITVPTDERTVQRLIEIASGVMSTQEVERQRPPARKLSDYQTPEEREEEDAEYFGGVPASDPGEMGQAAEPLMGRVAEEEVSLDTASGGGIGNGPPVHLSVRQRVDKDGFALPIPSRTVEMDEAGYPVVPGRRAAPREDGDDGTQL